MAKVKEETLDLILTRLARIEQALLRIEKNVRPAEITYVPKFYNDSGPRWNTDSSDLWNGATQDGLF